MGSGARKETEPAAGGERRSHESGSLPDAQGLRIGAVVLAIALASFAVYGQILDHAFVDYDDYIYFIDDPDLNGRIEIADIVSAFVNTHQANWSPATTLSILLGDALHGPNSAAYLFTNWALHFLGSSLLFLALLRMTGMLFPSAWVALVFALHPLHVESVAWASERKDVLTGVFWMGCLLVYARYSVRPSPGSRAAFVALGMLAALAKPTAVTLPIGLLLLDYWPLGRLTRWSELPARLREKWPLFALALCVGVLTLLAQGDAGANRSEFLPWSLRIMNAGLSYWTYLVQTFWPLDLSVFYPYPSHETLYGWRPLAAWFAGILLTGAALRSAERRPYLVMGWLWFVLMLVPTIGFVQVGGQAHADRYMYIPMVGLLIALAWGLTDWARQRSGALAARGLIGLALVTVIALAGLSWRQVGYWRNSITLFERAIAVTGPNSIPHRFLGVAYWTLGERQKGEQHLRAAVEISPNWEDARLALGDALNQAARHREAQDLFVATRTLGFSSAALHAGLGIAAQGLGDDASAALEYRLALEGGLEDWEIKNNLAWLLATTRVKALRDPESAVQLAREALAQAPDNPQVKETLAAAQRAAGSRR
jgi:tetratricopeptide (TPR) repeat protein